MLLIPTPYRYIAVAVAVALLALGAKLYISGLESAAYERGKAELQAEYGKQSLDLALAYAERIKVAQEERDANQTVVDRLRATAGRVRIIHPKCPDQTVTAGTDTDGGAGLLSEKLDAAFDRLRRGTESLVERCDELNLDAIKFNTSLAPHP